MRLRGHTHQRAHQCLRRTKTVSSCRLSHVRHQIGPLGLHTWSGDYYSSISDHIHALGVIAANFNTLELAFYVLFAEYLGNTENSQALFAGSRNNFRIDVLTTILERYERNAEVREAMTHFIQCSEICAENRNTLMHSRVMDVSLASAALPVQKGSRRSPLTQLSTELPLERLRSIADEIFYLEDHGWDLADYFFTRRGRIAADDPDARTTLPERLPLPMRLILPPHEGQDGFVQQRSSRQ